MFTTLIRSLAGVFSRFTPRFGQPELNDVTHLLEVDTSAEKPILHAAPSPFVQWVDELDDEVTESISRRHLSQLLLQAEAKATAASEASKPMNIHSRYAPGV